MSLSRLVPWRQDGKSRLSESGLGDKTASHTLQQNNHWHLQVFGEAHWQPSWHVMISFCIKFEEITCQCNVHVVPEISIHVHVYPLKGFFYAPPPPFLNPNPPNPLESPTSFEFILSFDSLGLFVTKHYYTGAFKGHNHVIPDQKKWFCNSQLRVYTYICTYW